MLNTKYIALMLAAIGLALFCYSLGLKTYTNKQDYFEKYNLLQNSGDTEAFYELRKSHLTPKYKLEDYGIALLIVATSLWVLFHQGWNIRSPKRRSQIAIVGCVAVVSSIIAFVGDLFLDAFRGEFPHWADTIAIPLMSIPSIFYTLMAWYAIQLTGFIGSFSTNVEIHLPKLNIPVLLYGLQLTVLLLITAIAVFEGAFWYIAPAIIWCTFFMHLMMAAVQMRLIQN